MAEKKIIYMDNAATTRTAPEVVEAMLPWFSEHYGNPSSIYSLGSEAKAAVSKASTPAVKAATEKPAEEKKEAELRPEDTEIPDIPYDLMTVEQLQAVILKKMAKNGPVTERMRRDVIENVWHNSLVNWANSFR